MLLRGQAGSPYTPCLHANCSLLPAQAHLDRALSLHKPASQHGLCVLMAQLGAGLENLLLHLRFQQQPAQPPV